MTKLLPRLIGANVALDAQCAPGAACIRRRSICY